MATKNRGVAVTAIQSRIQQEVDRQLDRTGAPALSQLGIVDTQTGDTKYLDLTWMRKYSMMREFVDERDLSRDRRLFKARMFNRTFEDSVRIDIEDIEDDIGMLNPEGEAQSLVQAYEDRVEWEQHAYLINAFNENYIAGTTTGPNGEEIYVGSMDGEPVLSDSHPYYEQIEYRPNAAPGQRLNLTQGGEFSNLVDEAFSDDALWNARKSFQKLVDFRGRPANFGQPDTLIVPPDLEREAMQVLERATKVEDSDGGAGAGAVENETQGIVDIFVDPYLVGTVDATFEYGGTTYTDKTIDLSQVFFLVNSTAQLSPFVMWDRKDLELQTPVGTPGLDEANPAEGDVSHTVFMHDAMIMGARARFGMSFGMPQVMYGSLGGQLA